MTGSHYGIALNDMTHAYTSLRVQAVRILQVLKDLGAINVGNMQTVKLRSFSVQMIFESNRITYCF